MRHVQFEIVSIAEACLGGLRGRVALLIGSEEMCQPYHILLQQAGIQMVYREQDDARIPMLLPQVQLLMNVSDPSRTPHLLTAALIAEGCVGRRTPLVIFDLAVSTSVEELAGLLPAVCLYTPSDLRHALCSKPDTRIA
ncbi:MAG: hypothetical protein ACRDHZ_18230 [Ktedonobacteraceae bacterium]